MDPSYICFAYSPTEYAIFSLENSTAVDVTMPALLPTAPSSTGLGMGTFSGLSSYMSLGLGSKTVKPGLTSVGEGEVLVVKESKSNNFLSLDLADEGFLDQGFVVDVDANAKSNNINWPSQPEEVGRFAVLCLYLLTVQLLPLDASSIREPIHIFYPSRWYGTRYRGTF